MIARPCYVCSCRVVHQRYQSHPRQLLGTSQTKPTVVGQFPDKADSSGPIPKQNRQLWVQCVRPRSDTARPIASSTRAWKDAICSDLVFRRQSLSLVYSRLSMAISAWRGSLEGTWGKRFDRSHASSCAMPHQCRTCSRACCMNSAALDSSSVASLPWRLHFNDAWCTDWYL